MIIKHPTDDVYCIHDIPTNHFFNALSCVVSNLLMPFEGDILDKISEVFAIFLCVKMEANNHEVLANIHHITQENLLTIQNCIIGEITDDECTMEDSILFKEALSSFTNLNDAEIEIAISNVVKEEN